MSAVDRPVFFFRTGSASRAWSFLAALALGLMAPRLPAAEAPASDADADETEDVTTLAPYNVKADRVEDFGLRVSLKYDRERSSFFWPVGTPLITAIVPNTAAAKAGLQPGERVLKSDGQSTTSSIFSMGKWRRLQQKKWAEVSAGRKNVTWTLEVETVVSKDVRTVRTVKLVVPTPAPHWGSSVWQAPQGRPPATVPEPGPLADRSRVILDNGIWTLFNRNMATTRGLGLEASDGRPFLVYQWSEAVGLDQATQVVHRMSVSQQHGRTEIVFETSSRGKGVSDYLTSPSGALEKTWRQPWGKKGAEIPLEEARAGFREEMDFWLTKVDKVSARWPLELVPDKNATSVAAAAEKEAAKVAERARAASFLKLAPASEAQRKLFAEAMGKIGADEDHWAYTETSHGLDDKHVATMRVDPSKPDAERCTLLKMDGKPPTAEIVKRWRDEGRDASASLGELPPISGIVDTADVRVFTDEPAAVVFELPLRASNPQFPAEKFQALFRVNKTQRAFEDIVVKLRESFRVVGVVSISEAGMEVRFQTFDPAYAPQPVWLKAGGAVRLLLVKLSRSFEATRTDFKRVEPYEEPTPPAVEPPAPILTPSK